MVSATELFEEHRRLLFSVAYRILGSATDAEDVVQDSWLRWSGVDIDQVSQPKAYLVRVATNTALNRLRANRAQRETYIGPWLPEPIVTGPDIAEEVEMTESVSVAMLVVLETLSPDERAVFVLREVFGFPHAEIATTLDRSEASVRQLAHRARSHVQSRRPRFETDRAKQKEATDRFLSATLSGDINRLLEVLAPDVTMYTDGGGKITAALNPVYGADKVSRFLVGIGSRPWYGIQINQIKFDHVELNGAEALIAYHEGKPIATVTVDVSEGRIEALRLIANPDKLRNLPDRQGDDDLTAR